MEAIVRKAEAALGLQGRCRALGDGLLPFAWPPSAASGSLTLPQDGRCGQRSGQSGDLRAPWTRLLIAGRAGESHAVEEGEFSRMRPAGA